MSYKLWLLFAHWKEHCEAAENPESIERHGQVAPEEDGDGHVNHQHQTKYEHSSFELHIKVGFLFFVSVLNVQDDQDHVWPLAVMHQEKQRSGNVGQNKDDGASDGPTRLRAFCDFNLVVHEDEARIDEQLRKLKKHEPCRSLHVPPRHIVCIDAFQLFWLTQVLIQIQISSRIVNGTTLPIFTSFLKKTLFVNRCFLNSRPNSSRQIIHI